MMRPTIEAMIKTIQEALPNYAVTSRYDGAREVITINAHPLIHDANMEIVNLDQVFRFIETKCQGDVLRAVVTAYLGGCRDQRRAVADALARP